jgi:hypothetical protein
MTAREINKLLEEQRNENHHFVKVWRKENDFLDYDLIDRFVENLSSSTELGGIDLLTMEDMWSELQRFAGSRVKKIHDASGDKVEWEHHGKTGTHTQVCMYTPETIMAIFDVESKGNPVGA